MTNKELLQIIEQAVRFKVTTSKLSGKGLTTLPNLDSLDKLNKRLSDRRYQIECENSYEMVDVRRLIDDVMFQPAKADGEINPKVTPLQSELEEEKNELLTHRLADSKEIFISYAWGGKSEQFVNKLDETLQAKGITIIRDKRDLGYKGLIKAFMERIGRGKCAIAVISDKYLKSPNCMFELVQIAKNGKFHDRIFPIVLSDANIYQPIQRADYIIHWEGEIQKLEAKIKLLSSSANVPSLTRSIDEYTEIRATIDRLVDILQDMNTLTPDIDSKSDFEILLNAIAVRLYE